jgi:hypothetical protein
MALRALVAPPPATSRNSRWGSTQHLPALGGRLRTVGAAFRSSAAVAASHVQEHGYFMAAMGCADAAGFTHSVFTGLIVAGASFLALEWRVSKNA